MMRMKPKSLQMSSTPTKTKKNPEDKDDAASGKVDWELRPGGMLVQKRNAESDRDSVPAAPTIRVRVKHGSSYHEIYINSRATFGELKKLLAAPTALHPQDQKLFFKDKERDSKAYLDVVGVKERSKIVLVEDPTSQERRYIEMRKTAKMEKASKSISEISLEVDKLAAEVSALETVISKGGKVADTKVLSLIELLMNQLIKLDGIIGDGDVKLQRKMQVTRVQKYVETLDLLKIRNSMPNGNGVQQTPMENGKYSDSARKNAVPIIEQQQQQQQQKQPQLQQTQPQRHPVAHSVRKTPGQSQRQSTAQTQRQPPAGEVVVTTKWETFDQLPPLIPHPSSTAAPTPANKLNWEFFE